MVFVKVSTLILTTRYKVISYYNGEEGHGTVTQRLFDNIGTVFPIPRLIPIIIPRNIIHANLHNSHLLFLAEFVIFLYQGRRGT